ncbi:MULTISPECIES: hypothetical protein [Vibrio]|uniref:Yip1 domain-containing protein n=1 Tax=Vibrio chanodichtyis TaxID=3027932 RepID=A0ABT5UWC0_9VIBR|nr:MULTISPECIES: hypothetical protein [Vibrio]MDE1513717.1 hypothetical protein [Vibrio chanodichtyis]
MLDSLLSVLAPMLLGAQIIMTLVLVKGEICPGQRGRLHKLLPALLALWLAMASLNLVALLVALTLFYFYSQVQTQKTREQGPLWVLYFTNGFALVYVLMLASQAPVWSASLMVLVSVALLGALFAHLLLSLARSRLQAFQRILPVVGVLAAMLIALCILPYIHGLDENQIGRLVQPILLNLAALIIGCVVWCWHLLSAASANKWQLAAALCLLLKATSGLHALYFLV